MKLLRYTADVGPILALFAPYNGQLFTRYVSVIYPILVNLQPIFVRYSPDIGPLFTRFWSIWSPYSPDMYTILAFIRKVVTRYWSVDYPILIDLLQGFVRYSPDIGPLFTRF
jgi:hypothetical protein